MLKAVLKETALLGDIPYNPAENIPIPNKKRKSAKAEVFLDAEDMKTIT